MSIRRVQSLAAVAAGVLALSLACGGSAFAQHRSRVFAAEPSSRVLNPDLLPVVRARFQWVHRRGDTLVRTGRVLIELLWRFGTPRPRMLPPWVILGEDRTTESGDSPHSRPWLEDELLAIRSDSSDFQEIP